MSTDNASDKETRNNWSENFLQRFAWWKRNSGRVFKTPRYQIALRVDLAYCDSKLNPRRSLLK